MLWTSSKTNKMSLLLLVDHVESKSLSYSVCSLIWSEAETLKTSLIVAILNI